MLGLFRSQPFHDEKLGELQRHHGRWMGTMMLPPHGSVQVRLAGGRQAPVREALDAAAALADQYGARAEEVVAALYEHYEASRDAWTSGELDGLYETFPELTSAAEVWTNIRVEYVDIDPARGQFPVEIRVAATWDEEHTLGVRMNGAALVELCGSVGP